MSSWVKKSQLNLDRPLKKPKKDNTVSITVCVNFADKLRIALEINSVMIKKMYIVTDPSDKDTIDLCKGYRNVEILLCSDVHKNGATFNKSGLIKFAQVKITPFHREDWIIIIDADTIIPSNFWSESVQQMAQFTENSIYLLKRKIYNSNEDLCNDKFSEIHHGCGFFQMYYNKNKMYSDFSKTAGECDVLFQNLFRNEKVLNGFCIHLGQNGLDWNGRIGDKWIDSNG